MTRAGHFSKPPDDGPFIPHPLKPGMLRLDDGLIKLHGEAASALGRLDGAAQVLPDVDLFVAMYSRREALLSSQIEGTQASLLDVLEGEADDESRRAVARPDVREVLNHQQAIRHGLSRLDELPISVRFLDEIHEVLMQGTRGDHRRIGEFRKHQNWIGPPGSSLEEATFIPPPVPVMVEGMSDLEKFIHRDQTTPILLKSGLVHYQFETLHPYEDGNGRMGRLLITFLLAQDGALSRPLLYLSLFLKRHRAEYYELLNQVRLSDDFEGWIRFFLRGVREVSNQATGTARAILEMREEHIQRVRRDSSSSHAAPLVEALLRRPAMTVRRAERALGVSYGTANKLMSEFQSMGLVEESTGRSRGRIFVYVPYLDLLEAD